ncbi:helix-turn-helix transcriptional regulator [Fulvivirgaceae bacterium BMA12]|uniref:Helix-turn-helix transcriptional regulator n=1 Tax=Agaribacillus aureus TaxID=3051825 RepID=A0ABT8LFC8_9BACT|nr:helix-turn-helix transcriptional regulator [Fulvivirgaceae bacterium BMA12]
MSDKDIKKQFGKRIRELRLAKNLTQLDLSVIINTDNKHLSHIELGHVDVKLTTIHRLADALEIDIRELFKGD